MVETKIDLTKLYSELRAYGYIRATYRYPNGTIEDSYSVTPAGIDHEKFLLRKHSQVSARLLREMAKDPKSNSVHMAALGALTLHDFKCAKCTPEEKAGSK